MLEPGHGVGRDNLAAEGAQQAMILGVGRFGGDGGLGGVDAGFGGGAGLALVAEFECDLGEVGKGDRGFVVTSGVFRGFGASLPGLFEGRAILPVSRCFQSRFGGERRCENQY